MLLQPPPYAPTRLDPLSYAAPSRIQAFLCPVGPVSRPRFLDFVRRLEDTAVIRLGDVTPDPRPERMMFSPLGFPDGMIVYNFTTTADTHNHILEDLELHRRTLVVFGLADYNNITDVKSLSTSIGQLQEQNVQAVIHKIILFDCPLEQNQLPSPDFICVPSAQSSRITSMRTVLGDLTSSFLAELPFLIKLSEAADTLASPLSRDDDYNSVILHSSHVPYSRSSPSGSTSSLGSSAGKDNRMSYPLSHHTERQRMRRKGRSMKMTANVYLLAGRTHDAMREYVEAFNVLKSVNDHLWHASSIEGIGICMLILSHLGVPFTIPSVVLPQTSTGPTSERKDIPEPPQLIDLLPQMTNTILSLYNRSQNFPGESLPQVAYVETILRTANLLTCTCLAGGWTTSARAAAVLSKPIPETALSMNHLHYNKMSVLAWITAAQAVKLDAVDAVDAASILTGIATAYGRLGCYRKRAFVLRQLVLELTPRISQARQLAQTLRSRSERSDDEDASDNISAVRAASWDFGVLSVLDNLCGIYGVSTGSLEINATFGWKDVQKSILKTCIVLCQTLPDPVGVVKYTTLLFKLAHTDLSIDEQLSLARNMRDSYRSAQTVGSRDFEDEYWDPYLVREIAVVDSSLWAMPKFVKLARNKSIEPNGPFIYNPFEKKDDLCEGKQVLVLDEPVEFRVLVQNPFAFELDVRAISLVGNGASFSSDVISFMAPARKLYPVSIYLTPTSAGTLNITGCLFQIYGCKETVIAIRPMQALITPSLRIKLAGLDARTPDETAGPSMVPGRELQIEVIPALPVLRVNRISLAQSSIMLLHGERRRFKIGLGNVSDKVSVTSLSLAFTDSTTESLTAALASTPRSDSNRYEIEVFLYNRPALRCITDLSQIEIPPNGEIEIEIEVYGKRGLTAAGIQISYSHYDGSEAESETAIGMYVRTLSLDINVSVNTSIEVASIDFVPFSFDMPIVKDGDMHSTTPLLLGFLKKIGIPYDEMENYCLMLLDLRNLWPSQLVVDLSSLSSGDSWVITRTIQSGHVTRFLVPVRRIKDIDTSIAIPSLAPPKQFTRVDPNKINGLRKPVMWTPEVERAVYWFREELLKVMSGRWRYSLDGEDEAREGSIELRDVRITPQMVDIVRVEDIVVDVRFEESAHVRKCGRKHWVVDPDTFMTMVVTVTSCSKSELTSGILRVQPTVRNLPQSSAMDVNLKIIFNGILQQPVLDIAAGESRAIETDCVALVRGEYEVVASFEHTSDGFGGKRYVGREKAVISVR
ncbi:TRAPP II complex [Lipomyces arxii]|uniref:TRAPP II complex n=1 Tax=Lipomyces arxii TaxID=56418 RepID=UPI0034CDA1B0